ncbi:hypothetical protein [Streptomyces sp. NPDC048191]|uniref:hypothetical protein n=1 Tax=Streptomyces sp. NPDC048191 TaxID=3155484 RepID=UPI0033F4EBF5
MPTATLTRTTAPEELLQFETVPHLSDDNGIQQRAEICDVVTCGIVMCGIGNWQAHGFETVPDLSADDGIQRRAEVCRCSCHRCGTSSRT